MVDLSLVKPGMHLKVVDDFDSQPGKCFAVPEMEHLRGRIVTCARIGDMNRISDLATDTASKRLIRIAESEWWWNDWCFDYIVELDDMPEREFAQCDISMLFSV